MTKDTLAANCYPRLTSPLSQPATELKPTLKAGAGRGLRKVRFEAIFFDGCSNMQKLSLRLRFLLQLCSTVPVG